MSLFTNLNILWVNFYIIAKNIQVYVLQKHISNQSKANNVHTI